MTRTPIWSASLPALLLACGTTAPPGSNMQMSDTGGSATSAGGGNTTTGSTTAGGGETTPSTGGSTGMQPVATAGAPAMGGGAPATGGSASPGGSAPIGPIGGTSSVGGSAPSGGTGGTSTAGGASPTGGSGTAGSGGVPVECATPEEETFSFFVISYEAVRRISGSDDGFGGDLGGLEGADDICRQAALASSDCAGNKTWRAFLSTPTEDAIDRIGTGPWHDRVGRLVSNDIAGLLNDRPADAAAEIIQDLPNEYGVPNHNPDGTGNVDNHQTLTGTGEDGRVYTQETTPDDAAPPQGGGIPGFNGGLECPGGFDTDKATCWGWTSSEPEGCPRVGQTWTRQGFASHWISFWNEGGCAAGVVLEELGGPNGDPTVGSAGGYGGWYCFA